jgi:GABA(A) receptor-associated protein
MSAGEFKELNSYEARVDQFLEMTRKYPGTGRVAVVIERRRRSSLPSLPKCKFLVPRNRKFGDLLHVVRNQLKIDQHETLYFMTSNGVFITGSKLMSQVYDECKENDGFLYLVYDKEAMFG